MFKLISSTQPSSNSFSMLKDLFPLITVILSLFFVLVATESFRFSSANLRNNPKSKPIVQNEELFSQSFK
ncbi:MAG: hypothetical protein EB078_06355 [Proteobacteria bacterium]|nr:hypothetical protein [Pseudomonadota bacterium]NDD04508.1 hypothetical protein [Pseudomonadota bacterium]NDG26758.1 hypothetical protein [Pseudomonadota bacterium]